MDPNANLREQIALAEKILTSSGATFGDSERLAELVLALDGWIKKGGFVPLDWTPPQTG